MKMGDGDFAIALFDDSPIRHVWHDGRWFYSVIDIIAAITQSRQPNRYWSEVKSRLSQEASEVFAKCEQLKLPAADGKMYRTDCADTETVLRIVQTIPHPNAEPFKLWLARVGSDELAADSQDERTRRLNYRRTLYRVRTALHDIASARGVISHEQQQAFIDAGYEGLYENLREEDIRLRLRCWPTDEPEDSMGSEELGDNIFQEVQTRALVEREDIQGAERLNTAHYDVGVETRLTIQRLGGTMPENLPRHPRLPKERVLEGEQAREALSEADKQES